MSEKIIPVEDIHAFFDDGMTEDIRKMLIRKDKRMTPSGLYCPCCGGVQAYVDRNDVNQPCDCREQASRLAHYAYANIGELYMRLSIEDLRDTTAKDTVISYIDSIDDRIDRGQGLLLYSQGYGTGKTLAASLILRKALRRQHTGYFITFSNLMQMAKDGWKSDESAKKYREIVSTVDLLVMDDIGKEQLAVGGFSNDYAKMMFESILRDRVQRLKTTIYTSNLTAFQIQQTYSHAVGSLLAESTQQVDFPGGDYRQTETRTVGKFGKIY